MNKSTKNERLYYYVQYQLKLKKITLSQLSTELSVSIGHIQRTIWGERESPTVRARLKEIFGCDVLAPDFDDYPKDIINTDTSSQEGGERIDI